MTFKDTIYDLFNYDHINATQDRINLVNCILSGFSDYIIHKIESINIKLIKEDTLLCESYLFKITNKLSEHYPVTRDLFISTLKRSLYCRNAILNVGEYCNRLSGANNYDEALGSNIVSKTLKDEYFAYYRYAYLSLSKDLKTNDIVSDVISVTTNSNYSDKPRFY